MTYFFYFRSCQQSHPEIIVKFLPSINISHGFEEAKANFQLFSKLREDHPEIVKGLDLSGDPEKGKFANVRSIFQQARDEGFKLALHCGEIDEENEIREMIEFMTQDDSRIGHGTFIDGLQFLPSFAIFFLTQRPFQSLMKRFGKCFERRTFPSKSVWPPMWCARQHRASRTTI